MIYEIHVEYMKNLMRQQTVWNMDMLQEIWKNGSVRRVGNYTKISIVESWIKLILDKILFYKRSLHEVDSEAGFQEDWVLINMTVSA